MTDLLTKLAPLTLTGVPDLICRKENVLVPQTFRWAVNDLTNSILSFI